MSNKKTRILAITPLLCLIALLSCGQSRQNKTEVIINKLNQIETIKTNYHSQLEPLKAQATVNDSIKILEIEKQLSEDKIVKRISSAFNELFSDDEINVIFEFIQTSAFEKVIQSRDTHRLIASQFEDIDKEIKKITGNYSKVVEIPKEKFTPIPVDKQNGFYATVDYTPFTKNEDIILENNPFITSKDIQVVKKTYSNYNNKPEISIMFTKAGAQKFYLLTKENIGKPVAIVLAKQIVSIPIINSVIKEGKSIITGDFSEEEINKLIKILQEK